MNNEDKLHSLTIPLQLKTMNMQEDKFKIDYNHQLMDEIGKLDNILLAKLGITDSVSISVVFTLLRRIDCYISDYTNDMAECYNEVKDKSEEIILSKMTEASHNALYYNYSGIDFNILLQHPEDIEYYLNSYANCFNERVKTILDMIDFQTLVAKMKHANCVYDVINLFCSIDLGPSLTSIEVCKVLRNMIGLRNEFYTPELYCYYAQAMLYGKEVQSDNLKMYDPVCGMGNLLNAVYFNALQIFPQKKISLYGQDINKYSATIMAACNLLIGDEPQNIRIGNTITEDLFPNATFQYIVADIPMGMPWKAFSDEVYSEAEDPRGRFGMGIPRTDSQLLFIQHIISKMDPAGSRAVIFTNSSPLCGGNSEDSSIRKAILEKDLLETVIALPKIKGATNVQRYLWVLSNNKAEHRKGKVHLLDANYMQEIESAHLKDDLSVLNAIYQFYDVDFPEPYHCFIQNKDFGNYLISIRDKKRGKIITVEVPLSQDPIKYLHERNIISDDDNMEILYDKTCDDYKIDFSKYFIKKEDLRPSETIFEDVQTSILAMLEFERELKSLPLPEVNKHLIKVENPVFSQVPKEWKGVYLSEVVRLQNGKKYNEVEKAQDTLPILTISDFRDVEKEPTAYTSDASVITVGENDVVIVSGGSNSGDIVCGRAGALGKNLILATPKNQLLHEDYLFYLMKVLHLNDYSKGAVVKRLSIKDIENIFIYLPSYEEQEKMVQYMYKLEGAVAGVSENLGVYIPSFMEYEKAIFSEIVTGKYNFKEHSL